MVDHPYLPSRPDDGCGGDPVWRAELALSDLQRSFRAAGYRGTLRDMRIMSRNASGRVAVLALDGLTPSQITGQELREAVGGTLGWQHVRSTLFEMRRTRDAFRFDGRGFGHGVGMCVIGSAKLAASGETAVSILQRYFPGATVGTASTRPTVAPPPVPPQLTSTEKAVPIAVSGILVLAAADDAADRDLVQGIAIRARDDLAKTLGVAAPALIRVQSYRTPDDYERATGRPWFTFGAVSAGEIHLMPLRQLAERGTLETTVRRQVVHLLTDAVLAKRPAWVREGAALYFADGAAASTSTSVTNLGRESCPTDTEFSRPLSPGSLGTAYAQARGCFARQVANGRSWRDVR
jgi:hypothetical protein